MKPSLFAIYPWSSVLGRREYEVVAKNIMSILFRTGDKFRELTWEEYKTERLKDDSFKEEEKEYFEKVITYCVNEERAMCFSPEWRDVYVAEMKNQQKKMENPFKFTPQQKSELTKALDDYIKNHSAEGVISPEEIIGILEKRFEENITGRSLS